MNIRIDSSTTDHSAPRGIARAMLNGALQKCPRCATGALFTAYLKVADHCPKCGEALHHQRADDAPPYFTMFIVGHIALGGILSMEQAFKPTPWMHAAIWLPFVLIVSLLLLPRVKGVLIGLQWALKMHGFGAAENGRTASAIATAPATTPATTPTAPIS